MNSEKIEILDSLRAFAALSVCLYHFVCTTTGYIQSDYILNLFYNGQFGVQLFFVISGFIIPWSMYNAGYQLKDFFKFFIKRLARLEPPYIFSIILVLAILFLREHFLGKSNDHVELSGAQIFLHLGYLIPYFEKYEWLNPVYWTLAVEFQYYLLIALLYIPLIKAPQLIRILIYSLSFPLSYIGTDYFLCAWLPVFFLGIILSLYKINLIKKNEFYIVTFLMLIFCLFRYEFGVVIFSFIAIIFILHWSDLKIIGLHFLGKFSYSIYLIHPILGASLVNMLSHKLVSDSGKIIAILSGILFTIITSYINYLLVERPSKNMSASIKYKK